MRGTVYRYRDGIRKQRITPACAGNSVFDGGQPKKGEDHPRVCGEQGILDQNILIGIGSPPRVRGTVAFKSCGYAPHRITPACAGNSASSHPASTSGEDHPRVCGEQL